MVEPTALEQDLGVAGELLERVEAPLGCLEADELHLVELVDA